MSELRSSLTGMLVLLTACAAHGQETTFAGKVRPFLNAYCQRCHGAAEQEGDRRFDTLATAIKTDGDLVDYQNILDQLNLSEMPPPNEKQPTIDQRREVIEWFTNRIAAYHKTRDDSGERTALRRLNAREYRNTVRDLLQLDMTMFDPTTRFPTDQTVQHRDNDGAALVTSGYLLGKYLDSAEECVDRALYPLRKPAVQTWLFDENFKQQPEIDQVHRKTNQFKWMTLYDVPGADKPEGAYGPIHEFRKGVPTDGWYEIRIRAEALNRRHPYDVDFIGTNPDEPLRLGIVAGNDAVGDLHHPQPIEPLLAEFELADEQSWYTARVRLDAGYTPRFTFPNGLMDARNLWGRLVKKYRDRFPNVKTAKPGIVEVRFNAIKFGKLPQIRIHEVEIKGPLFDQWPTSSQKSLLGEHCGDILQTQAMTDKQIRDRLTIFARRAFRRELRPGEIDPVLRVVAARREMGRSALEAFADGAKTILASPSFLYHGDSATNRLSQMELASRLSYFLWSTTPDDQLVDLATRGDLQNPRVLAEQVERMLADQRSDAFIDGLLDSWLTLRELGSQPPDRSAFRDYYRFDLGTAMRRETHLFTRHLIQANLPVSNFLDSDFTFVNSALAKHYKLEPPPGPGFQKVSIADKRRGGLLGQASVLTVTANGIDTSPIVRGVWLLENILGTPPSPPPPDIEPLDPDIRGAKTIREQLSKHRDTPSCYSCHRKIDPPGFALENFDPIGRWRTNYPGKRKARFKIDASGELSGSSFDDVRGFKALLVEQQPQFNRALTGKILAHATGRSVSVLDRPEIDAIVKQLQQPTTGLRDLIRMVVLSDVFSR